jgi:hypothetical protein
MIFAYINNQSIMKNSSIRESHFQKINLIAFIRRSIIQNNELQKIINSNNSKIKIAKNLI